MPQPPEDRETGGTVKRRLNEEWWLQVRLLGLATTCPHHSSPFLQDTMAIKKQKRCRKIRPVSAFISESPASILTALFPFLFSLSCWPVFFLSLLLVPLTLLFPQVGALRTWKASWGAWGSPLAGSQDSRTASPQLVAPGKVYLSFPLMAIN